MQQTANGVFIACSVKPYKKRKLTLFHSLTSLCFASILQFRITAAAATATANVSFKHRINTFFSLFYLLLLQKCILCSILFIIKHTTISQTTYRSVNDINLSCDAIALDCGSIKFILQNSKK